MIFANHFLTVHGVDCLTWAARYKIMPFTHPCSDCGRPRTTSVPFACGPLRGLMAPPCACGTKSHCYCVVRADGDDILSG